MMKNLDRLGKKFDFKFKNKNLLIQSLIHRSYLNENPKFALDHNERLEFLGDAVLELIVTKHLYLNYPHPEGDLTNWRAALVNAKNLSKIANELDLNSCLFLSRGEAKDAQSKARQIILANAMEALIGAIYLDQGLEATENFIKKNIIKDLKEIIEKKLYQDPKSRFQEIAQDKLGTTPTYQTLAENGPDHAKWFKVGLYLEDELVSSGEGASKQEAQVEAAENGLRAKNW